jgi:Family of unknown function (DUF6152)
MTFPESKPTTRLLLCALASLAAAAAHAHHTGAMFDRSRKLSIAGTVRTLEWNNPHIWLWLVVPVEKAAAIYAFEGASIGEMTRRNGWHKNTVKPGDKVTVDYAPFHDGKSGGYILRVTLANGATLGASE